MTTYAINKAHNGIEITFDGKPSELIRNKLKAIGYRWHRAKMVWYAKQNAERLAFAKELAEGAEPQELPTEPTRTAEKPQRKSLEEITAEYYHIRDDEGWHGSKSNLRTWDDKKLKALIIGELKKNGIHATGRIGRGGYTTSFTFTIKLGIDDIETEEEYIERKEENYFTAYGFTDAKGNYYHCTQWDNLSSEEFARIRREHYHREYNSRVNPKQEIIKIVEAIVDSFNYNHSDVMTDYFDVGFYEHYEYKMMT